MKGSRKSKKQLTREDHDIWGKVSRSAKPLTKEKKNFASLFDEWPVNNFPGPPLPEVNSHKKHGASAAPTYQPAAQSKPALSASQLDQNTTRKISRGKISIDGRLDLHGYNQQEAYHLLYDYVENAYYSGKRTLLVITGKGNFGRGILRENVPKWLTEPAFRLLISSFGESHLSHGGVGAIYVRIRRKSRDRI